MCIFACFRLATAFPVTEGYHYFNHYRYRPIIYVDDLADPDLYFDRIVGLYTEIANKFNPISIGVMISSDRILTSYNPFRFIIKDKKKVHRLYSYIIYGRWLAHRRYIDYRNDTIYYTDRVWIYNHRRDQVNCGRQIQPLPDEEIEDDLWHGTDRRNCPLHDLLVFRINREVPVSTWTTAMHTMETYKKNEIFKFNVFVTDLAKPGDVMENEFKYCESSRTRQLQVTRYEAEDAVVDCKKWLPREWGHFICIMNKKKEVHSGAMLFSGEKLFGIGCFTLFRGQNSILVFTDVRPYRDLILNTCTYDDSGEKPQKFGPDHFRDFFYAFPDKYNRYPGIHQYIDPPDTPHPEFSGPTKLT